MAKKKEIKEFPIITINDTEHGTAFRYLNVGYINNMLMKLKIYAIQSPASVAPEIDRMIKELLKESGYN